MKTISLERYPPGKTFAVALVDDTDQATLATIGPVYRCMLDHDIRLTKTVWPLPTINPSGARKSIPIEILQTATLLDPSYSSYCAEIHAAGCELAMHTASGGNNSRQRTLTAYALFEDTFGHSPFTNVMHGRNFDNLYWGKALVPSGILSTGIKYFEPQEFFGHRAGSHYYWGDICRERTRYVRAFETLRTDTLRFDPATPYHDPARPDVNWWFSSSNGVGSRLYSLLSSERLRALAVSRGACIVHFYSRVYSRHSPLGALEVDPRFARLVRELAGYSSGWYVPVVTLLDRLRALRTIDMNIQGSHLVIGNRGSDPVTDLCLHVPPGVTLWDESGAQVSDSRNSHGQVCIGEVDRQRILRVDGGGEDIRVSATRVLKPNYWRLTHGTALRVGSEYWHGRRGRVNSDRALFPRL